MIMESVVGRKGLASVQVKVSKGGGSLMVAAEIGDGAVVRALL